MFSAIPEGLRDFPPLDATEYVHVLTFVDSRAGSVLWYSRCTNLSISREEREPMILRQTTMCGGLSLAVSLAITSSMYGQTAPETFTATATVKTAGKATASSPITITIDRKMPQAEAEKFAAAFKAGGAAALRKALVGVPPTGSVQLGAGTPTPTRLTIERPTDKGRLLTIVSDTPILFLGAGLPGAKPKEGYDFAVVDLEVDAKGSGSGTLAPAAKVTVKDGAFVVQDYGAERVQLTAVSKKRP
jgi:hypothetical protein